LQDENKFFDEFRSARRLVVDVFHEVVIDRFHQVVKSLCACNASCTMHANSGEIFPVFPRLLTPALPCAINATIGLNR
jgi:hypothetical protein